ncbi:MAG: serine hydrolase [Pseudomonadota bacterium]
MTRPLKLLLMFVAAIALIIVVALLVLNPLPQRLLRLISVEACHSAFLVAFPAEEVNAGRTSMGTFPGIIGLHVDTPRREVAVTLLGIEFARSRHRPGYGCAPEEPGRVSLPPHLPSPSPTPWPLQDSSAAFPALNDYIQTEMLSSAEGQGEDNDTNHRAILVMQDGKLVAEHYAPAYNAESRFATASIAKSVNALLWAIADDRGLADLDAPAEVPEWPAGDSRVGITNRNLVDMVSGLDNEEDFSLFSRSLEMITSPDTASVAARASKIAEPGERFYYVSADTNIASRSLQYALSREGWSIADFAETYLFDKIGADSFELVTDGAGTFIGSSLVYATGRDWARLAQLTLQEGKVNGEQVLPAGLTDSFQTPVPASKGAYKFSVWLNREPLYGKPIKHPGLPLDTLDFHGVGGNHILMIPSSNTVIVRIGQASGGGAFRRLHRFIAGAYVLVQRERGVAETLAANETEF